MATNLDRYKSDLEKLLKLSSSMELDLTLREKEKRGGLTKEEKDLYSSVMGSFERKYQRWYTESLAVIKQLAPGRLVEFENLYKGEGKRREVNVMTYNIQDWLNGVRAAGRFGERPFDDSAVITMRFYTQCAILASIEARFESTLFDIKQLVQADLLDSELESSSRAI